MAVRLVPDFSRLPVFRVVAPPLLVALCLLSLFLAVEPALGQTDWLATRQKAFAEWQKAHGNVAAEIADLKAKTAALVAAAGPPGTDINAPPVIHRVDGAISEFWDDPVAPRMVVIPAGSYTMGSPVTEALRASDEGPQHRVTIDHAFALGKYTVTRDEYAEFVAETSQPDGHDCGVFDPDTQSYATRAGATWRDPGFPQTGSDPVVCVSKQEAEAYIAWLSKKTGKPYRLPTEAEWEYAARAGTTTARYWGAAPGHDYANFGIEFDTWPPHEHGTPLPSTRDTFVWTAPVGSFPPNPFGLYDMIGNSFEWTADCYHSSYAPEDATECSRSAERGGDWVHSSRWNRAAFRGKAPPTAHINTDGFRLAMSF